MRRLLIASLLAASAAAPARAQADGPAGAAPVVDATALPPQTLRYALTLVGRGERYVGTLVSTREAATEGGRAVWRLTTRGEAAPEPEPILIHVVADRRTLRPLREAYAHDRTATEAAYLPDAVRGTFPGEAGDVDVALDGPVEATAETVRAALPLLPLAAGYRAAWRGFSAEARAAALVTLSVTGTATVAVPAGTFETYVVRLADAAQTATLYVDRATGVVVREHRKPGGGFAVTYALESRE